MNGLLVALCILGIVNIGFSIILLKFSIQLFVMIINLNQLMSKKFELGPNEKLKPVTLKFANGMYFVDKTGEPISDITLIEYSNMPRMNPDDKR